MVKHFLGCEDKGAGNRQIIPNLMHVILSHGSPAFAGDYSSHCAVYPHSQAVAFSRPCHRSTLKRHDHATRKKLIKASVNQTGRGVVFSRWWRLHTVETVLASDLSASSPPSNLRHCPGSRTQVTINAKTTYFFLQAIANQVESDSVKYAI